MLTKTQYKIIELLATSQRYSIRSAARMLGLSYALTYNNVKGLIRLSYVKKEEVPPASILKLTAPREILADIENRKRQELLASHKWAQLLARDFHAGFNSPFYILLIFGSYANKSQTERSDIDIIVITHHTAKAEKALRNIVTSKKLHSHVFTPNEFLDMLSKDFSIGTEALKDHVVLYGIDAFLSLR